MSKKGQELPVKKNAFVHKLYSMLNDPNLSHLIWWTGNEENNTFALYPGKEFANALTGYFKHGNVASFVRQLHMYGFHKVSDPSASEQSKNTPPVWEFKHSSGKFKKDDENSLVYIKRRSSSNSSRTGSTFENDNNVLIPTSSPSPNFYDPMPQHSFHFNQPPPPPPPHPYGQVYYTNVPHGYYPAPYSYPYNAVPDQYSYPGMHNLPPSRQSYPPSVGPNAPAHSPAHAHQPAAATPDALNTKYTLKQSSSYTALPRHEEATEPPQAQHYTPNLQFRKIWETSSSSRPRNPSLLYDPLAPAPASASVSAPPNSAPAASAAPAQQTAPLAPPLTALGAESPNTPSIPPPPAQLGSHSLSRNESTSSFSSTRDSFTSTRDSVDSRLSIKLPPPSSIHRTSSAFAPSPLDDVKLPRSIPDSMEKPEKPSLIPIATSIQERLRPSLIELHYGSPTQLAPTSTTSSGSGQSKGILLSNSSSLPASISSTKNLTGIMKLQQDSIGSHSSNNNSIFSNKSSLSSMSSAQRTSSFGSISHQTSIEYSKNSISIGPHDPLPPPETISEEHTVQVPATSVRDRASLPSLLTNAPVGSRPKIFRSLTPPNLQSKFHQKAQIYSPIPRSSTSLANHSYQNLNLNQSHVRSLTTSPLSKSIVEEESSVEPDDEKRLEDKPNHKVPVTSLLDDSTKYSNINTIINESDHENDSDSHETNEEKLTIKDKIKAKIALPLLGTQDNSQQKRQRLE